MSFWNNTENNPLKVLVLVFIVSAVGYVAYNFKHVDALGGKGMVLSSAPMGSSGNSLSPSLWHMSGTDANPTAQLGNHAVLFRDDQGGSMELGGTDTISNSATPYIDFHGNSSVAQDYNFRIINDANGQLSFQTSGSDTALRINGGTTTVENLKVSNGVPIYQYCEGAKNDKGLADFMSYLGSGGGYHIGYGDLTLQSKCKITNTSNVVVGYLVRP